MLITKSTAPRRPRPTIGRILLENADGHAHLTVDYTLSPVSRERVLYCDDGIYTHVREALDGQHVYRFTSPRSVTQATSEGLTGYQPAKGK